MIPTYSSSYKDQLFYSRNILMQDAVKVLCYNGNSIAQEFCEQCIAFFNPFSVEYPGAQLFIHNILESKPFLIRLFLYNWRWRHGMWQTKRGIRTILGQKKSNKSASHHSRTVSASQILDGRRPSCVKRLLLAPEVAAGAVATAAAAAADSIKLGMTSRGEVGWSKRLMILIRVLFWGAKQHASKMVGDTKSGSQCPILIS